jgi:hypothetical protein
MLFSQASISRPPNNIDPDVRTFLAFLMEESRR